ncbi:hypothetical protein [[Clostridium] fimetarium]|uniref:Uncharacterized protein n=1 Tax=[Clostridium] fimetarium TaxID=99656 RepID=A0A1I0MZE4_9FIRM|nr:hypothetical protein [[Clostridium] fimetarium]SEV93472.1 hypothetical protein SAMN05421659_102229 [[Clostridium] fimetarium]
MKNALNESKIIYDKLFSNYQKKEIQDFLNEVYINDKYDCKRIWLMDQKIGGIGGYCMPSMPTINPFPAGQERKLFRPLQYVRSEIEVCDIQMHPRYIVEMCGMHLEVVFRLLLERNQTFGNLRNFNSTLGKAVHKALQENYVDKDLSDILFSFISVFNKSKHEINMDESRERLFTAADCIVAYFATRIIGQGILEGIGYQLSSRSYEIIE